MKMLSLRRVWLYGLLITALLSSPFQMIYPAVAQDQTVIAPADRSSVEEARTISGPIADAALDQAPAPDRAVVIDQSNPNWQTVYGTEAGRQLLPPRYAKPETSGLTATVGEGPATIPPFRLSTK